MKSISDNNKIGSKSLARIFFKGLTLMHGNDFKNRPFIKLYKITIYRFSHTFLKRVSKIRFVFVQKLGFPLKWTVWSFVFFTKIFRIYQREINKIHFLTYLLSLLHTFVNFIFSGFDDIIFFKHHIDFSYFRFWEFVLILQWCLFYFCLYTQFWLEVECPDP